ncbi:hypothetical protein AMTR_s00011p00219420 [Amborella trichopoda]|uniref:PUB 62/63 C-terminal domain-containing protein n=1 Tax=Amborella trichopoda TaxID=13333 RepID=W1NHL3_AMBTC|nr:hypothetical protein AMTR_s00011p00219420 [Amborella trichopoda]
MRMIRRLFHNATLRKRRKEAGEHTDAIKRLNKENGDMGVDGDGSEHLKGVQYPFAVNEKVLIKGNRRTPDKFVGREAVITSQCLNGWYLLKILDMGESVRLQYRCLHKLQSSQGEDRIQLQPLIQNNPPSFWIDSVAIPMFQFEGYNPLFFPFLSNLCFQFFVCAISQR